MSEADLKEQHDSPPGDDTTLKGCFPLKSAYDRRCVLNSIITSTIIYNLYGYQDSHKSQHAALRNPRVETK